MTTVETPSIGSPQAITLDSPRRARWRRAARPAAALCAAAVLAGSAYQSWLLCQHHRSAVAAREASDAATAYAALLTTASPDTVDRQITELLDRSTGGFHERYARQSSDLRALLLANQVTTRGSVVDSAVKTSDPGSATVLLFVEQTFTSAASKDAPADRPAQPDLTAMAITLQKEAGRWLVNDIVAGQQQQ